MRLDLENLPADIGLLHRLELHKNAGSPPPPARAKTFIDKNKETQFLPPVMPFQPNAWSLLVLLDENDAGVL